MANHDHAENSSGSLEIRAGHPCPELRDYLLRRRSVSVKHLCAPGPDRTQIDTILRAAARVPDHGKLFPWYFIVIEGDARAELGEALKAAWLADHPDEAPAKLELEAQRFLRAPVIIAVVSKIREGKHPVWEQILSAGAACQNLCLAAGTLGFGTNWLTEWYSYSDAFRKYVGLGTNEHFAGFIYIGTPDRIPDERPRPTLEKITTYWRPGISLQKGGDYGHPGKGLPRKGFIFQDDQVSE